MVLIRKPRSSGGPTYAIDDADPWLAVTDGPVPEGADAIVPLGQGEALFLKAPEPKEMKVFDGAGHNDLVLRAGAAYAGTVSGWVLCLPPR